MFVKIGEYTINLDTVAYISEIEDEAWVCFSSGTCVEITRGDADRLIEILANLKKYSVLREY